MTWARCVAAPGSNRRRADVVFSRRGEVTLERYEGQIATRSAARDPPHLQVPGFARLHRLFNWQGQRLYQRRRHPTITGIGFRSSDCFAYARCVPVASGGDIWSGSMRPVPAPRVGKGYHRSGVVARVRAVHRGLMDVRTVPRRPRTGESRGACRIPRRAPPVACPVRGRRYTCLFLTHAEPHAAGWYNRVCDSAPHRAMRSERPAGPSRRATCHPPPPDRGTRTPWRHTLETSC